MRTWDDYKKTIVHEDVLFDCARRGDLETIARLQLSPARINAKNTKGHSALMLATYNGQLETARHLIARGADVNTSDHGGSTALMGAAFKGDAAVIELLLKCGADPSLRNDKHQTAADFARTFGQDTVLKYFDRGPQSEGEVQYG